MADDARTRSSFLSSRRLFPNLTATKLQAATYLLGVALFSISFLVFLNSSISFVVTDVIGQKEGVGDAVGTLGFADELLALVACPVWGLLSDKIGVRAVAVTGYCIVGFSLICLVQSTNVYPELLLGRLGFSIGGAACSTMVTAVLPSMIARREERDVDETLNGHAQNDAPSVSSELTITPTRLSQSQEMQKQANTGEIGSKLAGFVGLFTGAGALVALGIFLPLPTRLRGDDITPALAVQRSFYIVGAIAVLVAIFIFFGLQNLPGEEGKGWKTLVNAHVDTKDANRPSTWKLISESVKLGFTDSSIGLGYIGGFVARASSVGISLFIPLFVNAYFVESGLCKSSPNDLTDIKENCQRAYKLAAALSGIAETAALLGAPLFGYFGSHFTDKQFQWPLLVASVTGVLGYVGFGLIHNPDAFRGEGDSRWAIIAMVAIGISQIGAIVCSLAVLSRGINQSSEMKLIDAQAEDSGMVGSEAAPLLPGVNQPSQSQRSHLKGTIAGIYSLAGGAGILLLTKVGGVLFDQWTSGAPFFIMAIFNALLLVVVVLVGLVNVSRTNDIRTHHD